MKRYLLIVGDFYYPTAGTGDWKGVYETREEAEGRIIKVPKSDSSQWDFKYLLKDDPYDLDYDWYEIIDLNNWIL